MYLFRVGEGGSGVVYRAKWNKDTVAVKKLRVQAEFLLDSEKEDFKREAFLLRYEHAGTVKRTDQSITI